MIQQPEINIAVDITGILALLFMTFSVIDNRLAKRRLRKPMVGLFLSLMVMMGCDMFICIIQSKGNLLWMLHIFYVVGMMMTAVLNYIFLYHVRTELDFPNSQWKVCSWAVYGLIIVFVAVLLFNPAHHLFFTVDYAAGKVVHKPAFRVFNGISVVVLVLCIAQILTRKGVHWKKRGTMVFYCLLPLIAMLFHRFSPNPLLPDMAALSSTLIIYSESYLEQYRQVSKSELDLQNTRAALVLSQIQPHFLFNSMTAVMDLCDTDPREAKMALQELSDYLHYKISALSNSYVVSVQEDMEFLTSYLNLEKRRFGDRLQVELDIQTSDFQIPLLTLQPLVENAIRHGVSKRPNGGTVRISTSESPVHYRILVEDDGVGFEPEMEYDPSKKHIGLANVRTRLSALCGGTLDIISTPNVGTRVEIIIPKETGGKQA